MKIQPFTLYLLAIVTVGLLAMPKNTFAAAGPPVITSPPVSQTVEEGNPATFSVGVDGTAPFTFQWFKNSAPIENATNSSFTITAATIDDDGSVFYVAVTNSLGGAASGNAV